MQQRRNASLAASRKHRDEIDPMDPVRLILGIQNELVLAHTSCQEDEAAEMGIRGSAPCLCARSCWISGEALAGREC